MAAGKTALDEGELQVLRRIQRAVRCPEDELRYQLARRDGHPLARRIELLDLLAHLEARGLVNSTLHFALTPEGREALGRERPG